MPVTKISEAEFIQAWHDHGGQASKMAEAVGLTLRALLARRRDIERRTGQPLRVNAEGAAARAARYEQLSPREHKARHGIEIENGTVIVGSDAHFWPGIRTTAFRGMLKFIEELKPKAVVLNGDVFDGASISRFARIGWDSRPSVIEELKACKARLGEIEDAANGAKLIWPLGNHDARFEVRLAQHAPEFEGVQMFHLKDHFPEWVPCWSLFVNDNTVIKHRFKGGIHATHNNTLWSGKTIVTGHLHALKVTPFSDYNGTRWGVDTGTLAEPDGPQFADYLETSPTNWRSGFAVLTYHKGSLLAPELVRTIDAAAVDFRGHVIEVGP